MDLLRGRVRIGFAKEQVELASVSLLGTNDPVGRIEETASRVVETWTYRFTTYTFRGGRGYEQSMIERDWK